MKFIYQFLFWICFCHSTLSNENVDNYIKIILEKFAELMREGAPAIGMPILDPLNVSDVHLYDLKWKNSRLDFNSSAVTITGMSYYVPTYVHVSFPTFKMHVSLSLNKININGNYWCNGMFKRVFPLFGSGPFIIDVFRTTNNVSGRSYVTPDRHLQIKNLDVDIVFEELETQFENLLGGGDFGDQVNAALSQIAKLLFDDVMPWVNDKVVPLLVKYLNKILRRHTIDEIIHGILPDFSFI